MKKIEKLGTLGRVVGNDDYAWVLRELNVIINKQNEIIDQLNQFQKQPEGKEDNNWYCQCGEPANNGEHICSDTVYGKCTTEPEKQEEWREGVLNLAFVKEYLSKKIVANKEEEQGYADILNMVKDSQVEELLNFISQLLSERTFTKEELEIIEEWADIASEYPDDRKESDLLYKKISKLLELKEEE